MVCGALLFETVHHFLSSATVLVDSVDIIKEQRIKTQNLSDFFCANMHCVGFPAVAKLHNLLHI